MSNEKGDGFSVVSNGNVISLNEWKEENTPHRVDHYACGKCGFLAISVAPVGTPWFGLECGRCHEMTCVSLGCIPPSNPPKSPDGG